MTRPIKLKACSTWKKKKKMVIDMKGRCTCIAHSLEEMEPRVTKLDTEKCVTIDSQPNLNRTSTFLKLPITAFLRENTLKPVVYPHSPAGARDIHSAFRKSKSGEWGTGLVSTYFHADKDRWGSVTIGEERWGTWRNVEVRLRINCYAFRSMWSLVIAGWWFLN